MARLAGIPFKITSESTGEAHVLITDENGILSTASSQNKHSFNTNGNDFILNSVNNKQQKPTTDNQNKHKKSLLEDKNSVDHLRRKVPIRARPTTLTSLAKTMRTQTTTIAMTRTATKKNTYHLQKLSVILLLKQTQEIPLRAKMRPLTIFQKMNPRTIP